jgi:hypothetical protein
VRRTQGDRLQTEKNRRRNLSRRVEHPGALDVDQFRTRVANSASPRRSDVGRCALPRRHRPARRPPALPANDPRHCGSVAVGGRPPTLTPGRWLGGTGWVFEPTSSNRAPPVAAGPHHVENAAGCRRSAEAPIGAGTQWAAGLGPGNVAGTVSSALALPRGDSGARYGRTSGDYAIYRRPTLAGAVHTSTVLTGGHPGFVSIFFAAAAGRRLGFAGSSTRASLSTYTWGRGPRW